MATGYIYSSLFVKKNDSIEKIKKNVTKLQKNKLYLYGAVDAFEHGRADVGVSIAEPP